MMDPISLVIYISALIMLFMAQKVAVYGLFRPLGYKPATAAKDLVLRTRMRHLSSVVAPPSSQSLFAAKKKTQPIPQVAEFSRIINVAQIPARKSVLCRVVATDDECKNVAERFDIGNLIYLSANVTISRRDSYSIVVEGNFIARISNGELFPAEEYNCEFDTLLLDNTNSAGGSTASKLNWDDEVDYDDEVKPNGDIDVGEIVAQYLCLEMF